MTPDQRHRRYGARPNAAPGRTRTEHEIPRRRFRTMAREAAVIATSWHRRTRRTERGRGDGSPRGVRANQLDTLSRCRDGASWSRSSPTQTHRSLPAPLSFVSWLEPRGRDEAVRGDLIVTIATQCCARYGQKHAQTSSPRAAHGSGHGGSRRVGETENRRATSARDVLRSRRATRWADGRLADSPRDGCGGVAEVKRRDSEGSLPSGSRPP